MNVNTDSITQTTEYVRELEKIANQYGIRVSSFLTGEKKENTYLTSITVILKLHTRKGVPELFAPAWKKYENFNACFEQFNIGEYIKECRLILSTYINTNLLITSSV